MNIKKENIPVLVASNAYVGRLNHYCIFSVYLEKNAFWKIGNVSEKDVVIYTTEDMCKPAQLSGGEYHRWTIQHNQLLAKMPPLSDAERKYLKALIKPFRNQVTTIVKVTSRLDEMAYICILLEDKNLNDRVCLPFFKIDSMYLKMEAGKFYTPDELGL